MLDILSDIERWTREGDDVALATVVRVRGSSPRPAGARLADTRSGRMSGAVSAGCVESEVHRRALEVLDSGKPVAHDPAAGRTVLAWEGHELEAPHRPEYAAGSRVCWGIQPAHCVLHRRDRPSRGERENPVAGVIGEYLPFGENASVTLWVNGRRDLELRFSVPTQRGHA